MFTIELKVPTQLTKANVARLLGSETDSQHWQLRVHKDGMAYLSAVTGNKDLDDIALYFETWLAGNNYVGPAAAQDKKWVNRVYKALKNNWPSPKSTLVYVEC